MKKGCVPCRKKNGAMERMVELPFTQDVKELFFNDGVYEALDYAFRNPGVVLGATSGGYAQVHRARWMVEGCLEKNEKTEVAVECSLCARREACSEELVPCRGRPAFFFGDEKSVGAAFDALRSDASRQTSNSFLLRLERVILQEFPDEFYGRSADDSIEEKAIRLIRYAKELQRSVSSTALDKMKRKNCKEA